VINVTDRTIKNFKIDGVKVDGGNCLVAGGQCIGYQMTNCGGTTDFAFDSLGDIRFALVARNRFHTTTTDGAWGFSTAKGCGDFVITDNFCTGEARLPVFHIHEGSANIKIHNNTIMGMTTANDDYCVSVRGCAYDISIVNNSFVVDGPVTSIIFVSTDNDDGVYVAGSGVIKGNSITAPDFDSDGYGIRVADASGWHIDNVLVFGTGDWIELGNTRVNHQNNIWIGAEKMWAGVYGSSPTFEAYRYIWPSYTCSASVNSGVGMTVDLPVGWLEFAVYVWWANLSDSSGDILFGGGITHADIGDTVPNAATEYFSMNTTALDQNIMNRTVLKGINITQIGADRPVAIYVERIGTNADYDTLEGDIAMIGVELVRVK
jgi:hypothetical protein